MKEAACVQHGSSYCLGSLRPSHDGQLSSLAAEDLKLGVGSTVGTEGKLILMLRQNESGVVEAC